MARFYGQVDGRAKTIATRIGSDDITVSAQSWNGSVTTRLEYDENGVLRINLYLAKGSRMGGDNCMPIFRGTLEDLIQMIEEWNTPTIVETPKYYLSTTVLS